MTTMISTPIAARWLSLLSVHLQGRTLYTTLEGDLHTLSAYSVDLSTICFANRSWGATHDPLPGTALLSIERALARRNTKRAVYDHYDTQLLVIRFEPGLLGGFALSFLGRLCDTRMVGAFGKLHRRLLTPIEFFWPFWSFRFGPRLWFCEHQRIRQNRLLRYQGMGMTVVESVAHEL